MHALDAHIRRRLRAIILKHWKRRHTMIRRLVRFGVSPETARRSIYKGRRSLRALSHTPAVDRGLRNAYFAARGLQSLELRWKELHGRATIVIGPVQLTLALE